jgi:kumamolisin
MMKSYIKFAKKPRRAPAIGQRPRAGSMDLPWRIPQLCASYGWPTGLPGGGVIAIVELGGGWTWNDMGRFFGSLNQPVPKIGDFSVDPGADNTPGELADAEVALDIQVAAAAYFAATGQPATIRVYWANNDSGGIARAVTRAAADGCDVFSDSWGGPESLWGSTA